MTRNQTEAMALERAANALRACVSERAHEMASEIEALAVEHRAEESAVRGVQRVKLDSFKSRLAAYSDEQLKAARKELRHAISTVWDVPSMRGTRGELQIQYDDVQNEIERRRARRK